MLYHDLNKIVVAAQYDMKIENTKYYCKSQ